MGELAPGLVGKVEAVVTETDTADRWGSGLVPALGTPVLVGLMEGGEHQASSFQYRSANARTAVAISASSAQKVLSCER